MLRPDKGPRTLSCIYTSDVQRLQVTFSPHTALQTQREENKVLLNIYIFVVERSKYMSALIRQLGGEWSLSGFVSLIVINHKDQEWRYLGGNWRNFFPSIF